MANVVRTVIQFRRDTSANWLLYKDVIPAAGEPCFELDTGVLKIGDGVTTYENLKNIGGAAVSADGKSIILEDGVFKLAGFDAAEVGAQLIKTEDGLKWVVPSTETVEGLQTAVADLKSNVSSVMASVEEIKEIVTPSGENAVSLLDRIESLEAKTDGTGEGSIDAKIDDKLEEFANAFTEDGKVNTLIELINYVDAHGDETEQIVSDINDLKGLVGLTSVADQIANAGHITKIEAEDTFLSKVEAIAAFKPVKYEISHKPIGTLVDYREKEIRVMVPANTDFKHQNSGANADANSYYIGFKAYAPEGAVNFKEDLAEIISDNTMHSFEGNDFAGVDAYGRKYSIVWLAVAKYDTETQKWTRYGDSSSKEKYIGWYYSVEWYDKNGVKIGSDCIRINLSNEQCHNVAEPYYMAKVVKEVSVGGTLIDVVNNRVNIPVGAGLKSSEEIKIAEDGTVSVGTITWDKIQQGDNDIVFDGGTAAG